MFKHLSRLSLIVACIALSGGASQAETLFIPVLVHPVQPGQPIVQTDLATRQYEVSDTARSNYVTDMSQVIGTVALRTLPVGRPIPISILQAAPAVRKGKNTVVHYAQDGIDIQGVLVPTQDGASGDNIPCRNPATGVMVDALVLPDGTLSVASK